jgi:hypothetical protein
LGRCVRRAGNGRPLWPHPSLGAPQVAAACP